MKEFYILSTFGFIAGLGLSFAKPGWVLFIISFAAYLIIIIYLILILLTFSVLYALGAIVLAVTFPFFIAAITFQLSRLTKFLVLKSSRNLSSN